MRRRNSKRCANVPQEAREAQDALLSWSVYQRAQVAVQNSHAAPVLTALDEHGMSATKLSEAYEWALCRSLAGSRVSSTPGTQ